MTGFSRAEGQLDGFLWWWEMKGVNGRSLDVRCRLPAGYESLDAFVRTQVGTALRRGSVSVTLGVSEPQSQQIFRVNADALAQIEGLIASLGDRLKASPPRLDGLLALRGVLELEERPLSADVVERRMAAIRDSFMTALEAMLAMRREEGSTIVTAISRHLAEIAGLRQSAAAVAATQPAAIRDRIARKMAELLPPMQALSEERVAQEAALLAQRADVREELDRLEAHLVATQKLLDSGGSIGRKLDFLCQEFNREANTLCSKADDLALTNIGIELKAAIEQLREQVQNIE